MKRFLELTEDDRNVLKTKINSFSDVKIVLENLLKGSENVYEIIMIYKFCMECVSAEYSEKPIVFLEGENETNYSEGL